MYLVFKVETYIAFISQSEEYYAWKKPHESFYLKTFIIYILPHTTVFVFLIECDFSVFLVGGERKRVCVCVGVCVHACWGMSSIKVLQNVLFTIKPET